MQELESRKEQLLLQLKKLLVTESRNETSDRDIAQKKNEIERELVEIMDRLTQLSYLLKK